MNNRIKNRTTGCTENPTGKLLSRCKADRKAKEIHTQEPGQRSRQRIIPISSLE